MDAGHRLRSRSRAADGRGSGAVYAGARVCCGGGPHLSRERSSSELHLMPFWVVRRDWNGLDGHFRRFAALTCGTRVADAIAARGPRRMLSRVDRIAAARRRSTAWRRSQTPVIAFLLPARTRTVAGAFCVYGRAVSASADQRRLGACIAEIPGPAPCAVGAHLSRPWRRLEHGRAVPDRAHDRDSSDAVSSTSRSATSASASPSKATPGCCGGCANRATRSTASPRSRAEVAVCHRGDAETRRQLRISGAQYAFERCQADRSHSTIKIRSGNQEKMTT